AERGRARASPRRTRQTGRRWPMRCGTWVASPGGWMASGIVVDRRLLRVIAAAVAVLARSQFQRGQQCSRWRDAAQCQGEGPAQPEAGEVGTEAGIGEGSAQVQGRA